MLVLLSKNFPRPMPAEFATARRNSLSHFKQIIMKPHSSQANDMNKLFPIFLKLEEMRLLIVGGGNVALEKLNSILNNSPQTQIEMVAPVFCEEIKTISLASTNVRLSERKVGPFDLDFAQIIIVAVDDKSVSEWVHLQAKAKGKLVNVADTPGLCDFYLGSIVNKGHLKIAISTNGKSPTLAKRLKEILQRCCPTWIAFFTISPPSEIN